MDYGPNNNTNNVYKEAIIAEDILSESPFVRSPINGFLFMYLLLSVI